MIDQPEPRCPNCDALVSADAEWCGQCYERLVGPPAGVGAELRAPAGTAAFVDRTAATPAAPRTDPMGAAVRSAFLPGLGHWALGRRADAVARFVLAAWFLGGAVVVLVDRPGVVGTAAFELVFGGAALGLWVSSAVDAPRIASGLPPLVTSRVLMWASTAVVLASVIVGTALIIPAARGR